jgi:hypothetical protein
MRDGWGLKEDGPFLSFFLACLLACSLMVRSGFVLFSLVGQDEKMAMVCS